jgi:hypothetical protein
MAGKPEAFSEEENRVLRAALGRLQRDRGVTQRELGELLGIAQQNAGRLLSANGRGGMGRSTANHLARALGYRDAEHLLLEAGVLAAMKQPPAGRWGWRDTAVGAARSMGFDEAAIHAVVSRFTDDGSRFRPMKWWITKIADEDRELAAERAQQPQGKPTRPSRPTRGSGTDG